MIRNDDIGPSKLPQTVGFNVPDLPIDLHTRNQIGRGCPEENPQTVRIRGIRGEIGPRMSIHITARCIVCCVTPLALLSGLPLHIFLALKVDY